jgi:hypothetical protein
MYQSLLEKRHLSFERVMNNKSLIEKKTRAQMAILDYELSKQTLKPARHTSSVRVFPVHQR